MGGLGNKYAWGEKAERDFVDGLGTWKSPNPESVELSPAEKREWLQRYIKSHTPSPHAHHKAGVAYAKRKLAGMGALKK